MKIGLTGGIASGKSTASNFLKRLGLKVIDADKIAHNLMEPQREVWREVVKEFGQEILLSDDRIDRKKLGDIIFNDPLAKKKLDRISHPIIITEIKEQMELLNRKEEIIVVDIPLLIEVDMLDLFDEVWLVYIDKDLQIKRLMTRDNIDYEAALSKIESQMPLSKKRNYADRIIENDGTKEELEAKLMKIYRDLTINLG